VVFCNICFWPIPDPSGNEKLDSMKYFLTRAVIYSLGSSILAFVLKAKTDYFVSILSADNSLRVFIEKVPDGSLFFLIWAGSFLVMLITGLIYEKYSRSDNRD
jgi:hypothetical protein